jgi:hypothetical protein
VCWKRRCGSRCDSRCVGGGGVVVGVLEEEEVQYSGRVCALQGFSGRICCRVYQMLVQGGVLG